MATATAFRFGDAAGDQHAFSAPGGIEVASQRHVDENRLGERRQTAEPSLRNIRHTEATCPEAIMPRQVLDYAPGPQLPIWEEQEGLKPALRDGVRLMEDGEGAVKLVHVPVVIRVRVIQRAHCGPYRGHFGRGKTPPAVHMRFIWRRRSRDVRKVLHTCIHCWKQTRWCLHSQVPRAKLPLGWPKDVLAMDVFGPLSTARSQARFILGMHRPLQSVGRKDCPRSGQ